MKGNTKICKTSRFEPPLGGLRGNAQGSSMVRWKAHCRLFISDKKSSEDEIANVNFLRRYGTYVLQNTKKENLLRLTN